MKRWQWKTLANLVNCSVIPQTFPCKCLQIRKIILHDLVDLTQGLFEHGCG